MKKGNKKKERKIKLSQKLAIITIIIILFLIIGFVSLISLNKVLNFVNLNDQTPKEFGLASLFWNSQTTGTVDTHIVTNVQADLSTLNEMIVGNFATSQGKVLLKFTNIDEIDPYYTVLNTKLQVYVKPDGAITPLEAHEIINEWDPSNTNWITRLLGIDWDNIGGDYNPTIISQVNINGEGFYNLTLKKEIIQAWVNGSSENNGVLLKAPSSPSAITIYSSDNPEADKRPKLFIEYVESKPPKINQINSDTSNQDRKSINENITFTINWDDEDSLNSQISIFVCNSTDIDFNKISQGESVCLGKTFCDIYNPLSNIVSCQYNVSDSINTIISYRILVCDQDSCTISQADNFYINHPAQIDILSPGVGEEILNSPHIIKFIITDLDTFNPLETKIYYGPIENLTENLINELSVYGYKEIPWNIGAIYRKNIYLTIKVNDYFTNSSNSQGPFNIKTLEDLDPPFIHYFNLSYTGNITSGEEIEITTNISDLTGITAYANITSKENNFLIELQPVKEFVSEEILEYKSNWEASSPGEYNITIATNDIFSNNNTNSPILDINISKPIAQRKSEIAPSMVLPYHVIKVEGELNNTDILKGVSATLNAPEGFTFLNETPQFKLIGDFEANQIIKAIWFLSSPIQEGEYNLNITYYDKYWNNWTSNNFNTQVTSNIGSGASINSIDIVGYPVVALEDDYYAEIYFKKSGILSNADKVEAILYNPAKQISFGPFIPENNPEQGLYTFTRQLVGMTGQWELFINVTDGTDNYYANQFFSLISGIFDVRNIQIINTYVDTLEISFEALNKGEIPTDLWIYWNLTDSNGNPIPGETTNGLNTIGFNPGELKTLYISPKTDYIGQAKITILGKYGDAQEKEAGASRIFTIQPTETTPPGGTGGSGGGTTTPPTTKTNETQPDSTTDQTQENKTEDTKEPETQKPQIEIPKSREYWTIIIGLLIALIIVIIILIILVYLLYKKQSIMSFVKEQVSQTQETKQEKTENISKKIKDIEKKLKT